MSLDESNIEDVFSMMVVINKGVKCLNELEALFTFRILDGWIRSIFVLGNNVFRFLCLTNFYMDDFKYNLNCQFK